MDSTPQHASRIPIPKASPLASPLKQHPVSSVPSSPPDATQTIFLSHPSARLTSSPASSPRIVDPSPKRQGSVRPAMSETMESGVAPGADFFDDGSSDSEWEDSDGEVTQTFSGVEGLGLGSLVHGVEIEDDSPRGRTRERSVITALPQLNRLSIQDSRLSFEDRRALGPVDSKVSNKAREMSLKRLSKDNVRVVTTRSNPGTPRHSRCSSLERDSPVPELPKPFPNFRPSDSPANILRTGSFKNRHRRNTSESVLADSIIDAHVMTMRALESLSPAGSLSQAQGRTYLNSPTATEFPKFSSFSSDRQIKLPSISTTDRERPAHLPNHFIKTPYPFTAKKEFPKPQTRPRQRGPDRSDSVGAGQFERLDSGYGEKDFHKEYDDKKGKHVLGLVTSEGEYDLRSRLERNKDAQGVFRSCPGSCRGDSHSVVWLSLDKRARRKQGREEASRKLVRIDIPSNLMASSPQRERSKAKYNEVIDFDDKYFAERLRAGYHELCGSWFARTFSARKLKCIQLGGICAWSGPALRDTHTIGQSMSGLLAAGGGFDTSSDSKSPFTEEGLMRLYKKPAAGKARYTWVHWSRKITAWNSSNRPSAARHQSLTRLCGRRARSLDESLHKVDEVPPFDPYSFESLSSAFVPDTITTIQFTQALSAPRILVALGLMLGLSVLGPILWIFFGLSRLEPGVTMSKERSDRLGSGIAIGILTLLLEGIGFGAWVWFS